MMVLACVYDPRSGTAAAKVLSRIWYSRTTRQLPLHAHDSPPMSTDIGLYIHHVLAGHAPRYWLIHPSSTRRSCADTPIGERQGHYFLNSRSNTTVRSFLTRRNHRYLRTISVGLRRPLCCFHSTKSNTSSMDTAKVALPIGVCPMRTLSWQKLVCDSLFHSLSCPVQAMRSTTCRLHNEEIGNTPVRSSQTTERAWTLFYFHTLDLKRLQLNQEHIWPRSHSPFRRILDLVTGDWWSWLVTAVATSFWEGTLLKRHNGMLRNPTVHRTTQPVSKTSTWSWYRSMMIGMHGMTFDFAIHSSRIEFVALSVQYLELEYEYSYSSRNCASTLSFI
jgi:hypothetical protein